MNLVHDLLLIKWSTKLVAFLLVVYSSAFAEDSTLRWLENRSRQAFPVESLMRGVDVIGEVPHSRFPTAERLLWDSPYIKIDCNQVFRLQSTTRFASLKGDIPECDSDKIYYLVRAIYRLSLNTGQFYVSQGDDGVLIVRFITIGNAPAGATALIVAVKREVTDLALID